MTDDQGDRDRRQRQARARGAQGPRDHGYDVLNIDQTLLAEPICPTVRIDLTNFGEVASAILGGRRRARGDHSTRWCIWRRFRRRACSPMPRTFANNVPATYNVFEAAGWPASRTWSSPRARRCSACPSTRRHPMCPSMRNTTRGPESAYSLGKLRRRDDRPAVRALGPAAENRRPAVLQRDGRRGLRRVPGFDSDADASANGTCGRYIDARDGAQAVRKALEADFTGFRGLHHRQRRHRDEPANASLLAEVFPGVEIRPGMTPNGTLLSIEKARRMLGYNPSTAGAITPDLPEPVRTGSRRDRCGPRGSDVHVIDG